jgi:hypothetical protein
VHFTLVSPSDFAFFFSQSDIGTGTYNITKLHCGDYFSPRLIISPVLV